MFVSHEDIDHIGNLEQVMTACENATLVVDWGVCERYGSAFDFPLERCRWVEHGEAFDIGDLIMKVHRPPIYDSPSTSTTPPRCRAFATQWRTTLVTQHSISMAVPSPRP